LSRVELLVKHFEALGKSNFPVQETSVSDLQMTNNSLQQQHQSNMNAYKKKVQTAQIHFSFVTSRKEAVSEEILRETFSSFGYMLEINIKKADYNPVTTNYPFPFIKKLLTLILGNKSSNRLWIYSFSVNS
jgi:hypothetical protein